MNIRPDTNLSRDDPHRSRSRFEPSEPFTPALVVAGVVLVIVLVMIWGMR